METSVAEQMKTEKVSCYLPQQKEGLNVLLL